MANAFGIDLGTYTINLYNSSKKNFLKEINMIAIENKNTLFAYGDSAYEMYEKAPDNIKISFPLNSGVIADINNMKVLLKHFVNDISDGNYKGSDFYICTPTDLTDVERRAFFDLIKEADLKARRIYTIEKAIACGVGMGVDVRSSEGVMVVDIGYNTTEISVLSLGGIVLSKLIKTGGLEFDNSIKNMIRKDYNLHIGAKTAENVKISLNEIMKNNTNYLCYGRDVVNGLPVEREISSKAILAAIKPDIDTIVDNVKNILERTPPELAADIYRNGLFLAGGASLVYDLPVNLANGTGLKVNAYENAQDIVIKGLRDVINNPKKYRQVIHAF